MKDGLCWKQLDGLILKDESIVIPRDQELKQRIIPAHHDTITTGHPGINNTKELIQRNYYWVDMNTNIKKYIAGCPVCPTIRPIRELPVGELHPTEIPEQPWDIITMDFVGPLPESQGSNVILNIVN